MREAAATHAAITPIDDADASAPVDTGDTLMATNLAPRRWWTIMPIVFITYSLAYLDRANYGFAAAAGI
ncbi:hypothetical protein DN536_31075, partial [Burkholderia multivorans]